MLEVKGASVNYGKVYALKGVNLEIREGEIVCVIGANGAGKTTLLRAISGLVPVREGIITFKDKKISALPPENIVRLGISQTPEGRQVFEPLTVMDNLRLGAYILYKSKQLKQIEESLRFVFDLFPILNERKWQKAGTLSGGEQQMLAIGRALMSNPDLLLLDEPSMGLAPMVVREIMAVIKGLSSQGKTVLLVEQNARAALKISNYCYILETGMVVSEGKSCDLLNDEKVKSAYLGRGARGKGEN